VEWLSARSHGQRLCSGEVARRDPLTDLPTRHFFLEMLDQQIASAERYGYLTGVALFDVDGLRAFNDAFGLDGGTRS